MTAKQIQEATDKARLINACNAFARAMDANKARYADPIIEHKGKTLFRVNREKQARAKMTVNCQAVWFSQDILRGEFYGYISGGMEETGK